MRFNVNEKGKNILHVAVMRGSPEDLKKLMELGLDVNQKDRAGRSPLYYAMKRKNRAVILELLKFRCELNFAYPAKTSDITLHNLGLTRILSFLAKVSCFL